MRVEVVRLALGPFDLGLQLVEPLVLHLPRLIPADERVLGLLQLLTLGETFPSVLELVGHGVGRLECQQRMRHERDPISSHAPPGGAAQTGAGRRGRGHRVGW